MDELHRLTQIARKSAVSRGISAATYADGTSFDVFCEKWVTKNGERQYQGCLWIKNSTRDAYLSPATVARYIRRKIKTAFNG